MGKKRTWRPLVQVEWRQGVRQSGCSSVYHHNLVLLFFVFTSTLYAKYALTKSSTQRLYSLPPLLSHPMCRSPISHEDYVSFADLHSSFVSNAAIETVTSHGDGKGIRPIRSRKTLEILNERDINRRRGEKTVIFSAFTSYLDLLSAVLADSGNKCWRIDGNVPLKGRASEVESFTDDDSVSVM